MEEQKKYGLGQWLDTLPNSVKNCISINDFKDKYDKYYKSIMARNDGNGYRRHANTKICYGYD